MHLRVGLRSIVVEVRRFLCAQGALYVHRQAGAVKAAAVAADQLCHRDDHGAAIRQALRAALNRALAHGGGTHQTGTVHGAQGGCEQLGCAGGVAVDQTDHRQADGAFGIAAADDGAVAVFILGVGHRALRHDQIDAADGVIQNAAAVVTQVKHQAGGTIGAQGADGVLSR